MTSVTYDIDCWTLPPAVVRQYKKAGVGQLFEWQVECLRLPNVLNGKSLVYSAPTSAGKTLVAEIILVKRVIELGKKAIFIVPFISVVREKVFYMQSLFQDAGVRVEGFMGGRSPAGGFKLTDVAVCTIEKANSLINRLIEEDSINALGIVVVDELHLVGDPNRGYLLELLLAKLKFICRQKNDKDHEIQIIGMSATLPNLNVVADWLDAACYQTLFRPVPLFERILIGKTVFDSEMNVVRQVQPANVKQDEDCIVSLCMETICESHSVLIFCPSKSRCEKLSETISSQFHFVLRNNEDENFASQFEDDSGRRDMLEQLRRCPVGLDETLAKMIALACAYHHAGLTFDERDIIEGGFRSGAIRVLVATSTLSSGVNLPARRVIIRTPLFNGRILDSLSYKQMCGRAGRKGVNNEGESILITKTSQKQLSCRLIQSQLPSIKSCLQFACSSLKRAILEVVVGGLVKVQAELTTYTQSTLLHFTKEESMESESLLELAVKFLTEHEFIYENDHGKLLPTNLGHAALSSALSPDESLMVFSDLQRARKCFVLESELHIIYQVTPLYCHEVGSSIDWLFFMQLVDSFSLDLRRVAELVGIEERFIAKAIRGAVGKSDRDQRLLRIHRRFYTSLILQDLINEVPVAVVAGKFKVNRGQLQALQQSASTFAGMVTVFCGRLGWKYLELILAQFQSRMSHGVKLELQDLVRLDGVTGPLARLLFSADYTNVSKLATASAEDIEVVLRKATPFHSRRQAEDENQYEGKERLKPKCFWIPGRNSVTEHQLAVILINDAKRLTNIDIQMLGGKIPFHPPKSEINEIVSEDEVNTNNINNKPIRCEPTEIDVIEVLSENKKNINNIHNVTMLCEPTEIDTIEVIPENKKNKGNVHNNTIRCQPSENATTEVVSENRKNKGNVHNNTIRCEPSETDIIEIVSENKKNKNNVLNNTIRCEPSETDIIEIESENKNNKGNAHNKTIRCEPSEIAAIEVVSENKQNFDNVYSETMLFNELSDSNLNHSIHLSRTSENLDISNLCEADKSNECCSSVVPSSTDDLLVVRDKENIPPNSLSTSKLIGDIDFDDSFGTALNQSKTKFAQWSMNSSTLQLFSELDTMEAVTNIPVVNKNQDSDFGEDECQDLSPTSLTFHDDICNGSPLSENKRKQETIINITKRAKKLKFEEIVDHSSDDSLFSNSSLLDENILVNDVPADDRFSIVNVTADDKLMALFLEEWRSSSTYSLALAIEVNPNSKKLPQVTENEHFTRKWSAHGFEVDESTVVVGFSVCLGSRSAFFFDFKDIKMDVERRSNYFKEVVQNNATKVMFECRKIAAYLYYMFAILPQNPWSDPLVADWLLDPDCKERLVHKMALEYLPDFDLQINIISTFNFEINKENVSSRVSSAAEAVLGFNLHVFFKKKLDILFQYYISVEMPVQRIVTEMELTGIGFDLEEFENQKLNIEFNIQHLEQRCFEYVGCKFSLTSRSELMQALFVHLNLSLTSPQVSKYAKRNRKPRSISNPSISLNKEYLEKLSEQHPLPWLICEFRRLSTIIKKTFYPFAQICSHFSNSTHHRIFPKFNTHTATGRIVSQDPNIQGVPKDISINFPLKLFSGEPKNDFISNSKCVKLRNCFVAEEGCTYVAADYSQMELRILTALSRDTNLIKLFNSGCDVFRMMAASLCHTNIKEVSDEQRQYAKQVCYGIIYGISAKTLSTEINTTEQTAKQFMNNFYEAFPGLQEFTSSVIANCRENGYVTTLRNRRRYLPMIQSDHAYKKAAAERQAINTSVQGTASEIIKSAMVAIRKKFQSLSIECLSSAKEKRVRLVLHLHDELVFEVPDSLLSQIIPVIIDEMESAFPSTIQFPVKIRVGKSWGELVCRHD